LFNEVNHLYQGDPELAHFVKLAGKISALAAIELTIAAGLGMAHGGLNVEGFYQPIYSQRR
jgi:hypothetical protein